MPHQIVEKSYRHQSQARLPKFVRMMVYSYLSVADTQTVSLLSEQERAEVINSRIARDGKVLKITFGAYQSKPEELRFKSEVELQSLQNFALVLVDRIEITLQAFKFLLEEWNPKVSYLTQFDLAIEQKDGQLASKIVNLISQLPARFQDSKISLTEIGTTFCHCKLKEIFTTLAAKRPDIVFEKIVLKDGDGTSRTSLDALKEIERIEEQKRITRRFHRPMSFRGTYEFACFFCVSYKCRSYSDKTSFAKAISFKPIKEVKRRVTQKEVTVRVLTERSIG